MLSTPRPTVQAQKVYRLLCDLENASRNGGRKQTILGQHCETHKESVAGEYWSKVGDITAANGGIRRNPGFVEFDFGPGNYQATYQADCVDKAVCFARDRFARGEAMVGFSFHQSFPGALVKSWENCFPKSGMDASWFSRVVGRQQNTVEYHQLLQDLSFAADKLQILQQANVPVLFRPFHEMNKTVGHNPFWWAARDPMQYRQLWTILHDYLVRTRGLKNLIFVWCPYEWDGTFGSEPWAYYPGADRVDVIAVDIYHGNPYYPARFYDDLRRYDKPRMLAECDRMPVRWGDAHYAAVSEIDARPWTIWSLWGDSLIHEIGATTPNDWNTSTGNKAIRDTYSYYRDYWRVLTGGTNRTYDWSRLR